MKNTYLSRFTPSSMTAETLEAIFVQRHELVKDLIETIKESALTKNKHFRLLIGGRGMGKTHTVSLIYHRLSAMDDLKDKLVIAWMVEEEWGISSFLDLLLRIFRALQKEYPEEYKAKLEQEIQSIYQMSADVAEHKAGQLLRELIGDRILLLLMENLDDIFNGLGDIGQKKFRAYLQNYSFITILATSQRLFNGVKQKNAAFYGWFYPQNLEQLELDEVIDLLECIAKVQGKKELESFIHSPTGRDRIKAIHHLAGGNHRVYVIFAEFLTRESLDDLIEPFMQTLDELTPYYQSRMQCLSPQQRKIVDFLCDRRHPVTVKEIAQYCFITHQTASSQLKDLLNKGYVQVESIGRESYYELQEVLMRYCLDVKKQRGEPISLFVDFLRCWYTKDDLEQLLEYSEDPLEKEYLLKAIEANKNHPNENRFAIAWLTEYQNCLKQKNYADALKIAAKLIEIRGISEDWINKGYCLRSLRRYKEAVESFDKAIHIQLDNAFAWRLKGSVLLILKEYDRALEVINKAIELNREDSHAWKHKCHILIKKDRQEEAKKCIDKMALFTSDKSLLSFTEGCYWGEIGDYEKSLEFYNKVIGIDPQYSLAWSRRGWVLGRLKRWEESLLSCDKAIELGEEFSFVFFKRTIALLALNRWQEGIDTLNQTLNLLADGEKPDPDDTKLTICNLFKSTNDREIWKAHIQVLIESYEKYKLTSEIHIGIVKNIPALMPEITSDKAAQTWLEIWKELTESRPEFQIPLRLLNTAVRYKQTKGDRRVLLELAIEERSLLEPLLK
jgi:tetratricopeptide (TPR) repeat protein